MTTKSITSVRTAEQEKQYRRFVEDGGEKALKEVNPDKEGLQLLLARGGEYQAYMMAGIRRFTMKAPNYELARTILGKDFISPEDIAKSRLGIVYTDDQLTQFGGTLPTQEVLEWCRDNSYMLVAGPAKEMSLLEVRELKSEYFYSKSEGWYAESKQKFSRDDKVGVWWIMLRKESVANSTSKTWNEQFALLSKQEVVPNVAEATWGVTTYKAVRGVYLLGNIYVRTSSLDSGGHRVCVGGFGAGGLYVHYCWDDSQSDGIGVSAARKPA
jgi:hypothetical protein